MFTLIRKSSIPRGSCARTANQVALLWTLLYTRSVMGEGKPYVLCDLAFLTPMLTDCLGSVLDVIMRMRQYTWSSPPSCTSSTSSLRSTSMGSQSRFGWNPRMVLIRKPLNLFRLR
ncbi:hypothetical protein C8Q79DRAFT_213112 [Trametes meyenii]|nr:hypothetical protein C8Q79DRAFT_213112 [Trametes meyenii]